MSGARQLPPRDSRGRFVKVQEDAQALQAEADALQTDLSTTRQAARILRVLLGGALVLAFWWGVLLTVDAIGEHLIGRASALYPMLTSACTWGAFVLAGRVLYGRDA